MRKTGEGCLSERCTALLKQGRVTPSPSREWVWTGLPRRIVSGNESSFSAPINSLPLPIPSLNMGCIIVILIALLCSAFCGKALAAEQSATGGLPRDVYVEGTYYGSRTVTFSLSVAGDRFVKTYGNGLVIIGKKENGEAFYYFINKNKRLITKVSQENLYRIGEFTNWNNMVGLINLKPGSKLIKENGTDKQYACTLYHVENEDKSRVCMDDNLNMPVYIEQNGRVIERTTYMGPGRPYLYPDDLPGKYLKNYRYVNADDDISPDAD